MKHIGLITTLHRRPQMTRRMLDYYATLEVPGVRLTVSAAYSRGVDLPRGWASIPPGYDSTAWPLWKNYTSTWMCALADNHPRSDKWNAAALALRHADIDGAFVIGSDDFLSSSYIEWVLSMERDYATPCGCHFYDMATGRVGYGSYPRVGAGRYLSRQVLVEANWQPWASGTSRNPDWALGQRVKNTVLVDPVAHPILDVKTDETDEDGRTVNVWTFDQMKARAFHWHAERPEWLAEHFPLLEWLQAVPS